MNICRPKPEFAFPFLQVDPPGVGLLELPGDVRGAIGAAVVYDNDFEVEVAGQLSAAPFDLAGHIRLCETVVNERRDDRQVRPLVVRREDDGVFALRSHDCWRERECKAEPAVRFEQTVYVGM